ncbi:MAG: hypothetical protein EOO73_18640 [Myxococcales bacterium]|nr:MAG: hypothetical protein EOO73_18640 [Myxococcales bacterium]
MRRIVLAAVTLSLALGCELDDNDWELDQSSGAATARGGRPAGAGGSGVGEAARAGSGGTKNAGGSGMAGASPSYPAPKITSMEPTTGAYGTLVTIRGEGLGNPELDGFVLALGNRGEVALTPTDEEAVVSWTDEEITFRFPFPAEGAVALEAPQSAEVAGEFQPTWHIAQELPQAPAASVLASISPTPDHIALLFDTRPPSLLDIGPEGVTEQAVTADDVEPESLRLYLNAQKKIEGVGVSTGAAPVIVHLQNVDDDLVATPTALELGATEYGVAGGSEGAAVWMHRDAGWFRARPSGATWTQDKGPIAEAHAGEPDRVSGATSDGSLFVAWSVTTGDFLDDMEAARMAKVAPTGTKFEGSLAAGPSVDDYVTQLTLTSRGDGLVVKTCGSDVDPFGLSGTSYYCFASLHTPSGASIMRVPLSETSAAYALTRERAVAAYCSSDQTWMIQTDADVAASPEVPAGEAVLFPCPQAVALEVSGEGGYLPVVRWAGKTYLLERNPNAVVDPE